MGDWGTLGGLGRPLARPMFMFGRRGQKIVVGIVLPEQKRAKDHSYEKRSWRHPNRMTQKERCKSYMCGSSVVVWFGVQISHNFLNFPRMVFRVKGLREGPSLQGTPHPQVPQKKHRPGMCRHPLSSLLCLEGLYDQRSFPKLQMVST